MPIFLGLSQFRGCCTSNWPQFPLSKLNFFKCLIFSPFFRTFSARKFAKSTSKLLLHYTTCLLSFSSVSKLCKSSISMTFVERQMSLFPSLMLPQNKAQMQFCPHSFALLLSQGKRSVSSASYYCSSRSGLIFRSWDLAICQTVPIQLKKERG